MTWRAEQHGSRLYAGEHAIAYVGKSGKGWWKTWLAEGEHWHLQPLVKRSELEARRYAEGQLKGVAA